MNHAALFHWRRWPLAIHTLEESPTILAPSKELISNESIAASSRDFRLKLARSEWNDYLPLTGTLRRSSSKKFSRKITWL